MAKEINAGNILKKQGCKNTKSRRAVIEILEKSPLPLSAEEIFINIKESGISINLSTVYRVLELIESKGLASKTLLGDGKARYELTVDGHRHHLICTGCRKMIPIDDCPLFQLEKEVGARTNFDITGHRLELYGLCPECRNGEQ